VHDPPGVGRGQGQGDLADEEGGLPLRQRPLAGRQRVGQRLPGDQRHDDVRPAAVLADLVNLADIGVVDGSRGPGLLQEAVPLRVTLDGRLQGHLQCHLAAQLRVEGAVHRAEGPRAEYAAHLEPADGRRRT
jgi:hypothetical protein